MTIGDRAIEVGQPTLIIAEIGSGHQGDLTHAGRLIEAAAAAGADCVKSQYIIADELVHPRMGNIALPGGSVSLYERFVALHRPPSFYAEMRELTETAGLIFLCTPFGVDSARALHRLGLPALKIASPELSHIPMLQCIADFDLPVVVSTGVSLLADIEEALSILDLPTLLLQCVTQYPAEPTDYNLRALGPLRRLFDCPVGVSDHSLDALAVPLVAAIAGGCAVEKHFTLSRVDGGLDDPIALDPPDFARMVKAIREVDRLRLAGPDGEVRRYVDQVVGAAEVEGILGSPRKLLAPHEQEIYRTTNRSLLLAKDLPAGTVLDRDSIVVVRSERNLTPGLHPRFLPTVLGARLCRDVTAGEGLTWDHLLTRQKPG